MDAGLLCWLTVSAVPAPGRWRPASIESILRGASRAGLGQSWRSLGRAGSLPFSALLGLDLAIHDQQHPRDLALLGECGKGDQYFEDLRYLQSPTVCSAYGNIAQRLPHLGTTEQKCDRQSVGLILIQGQYWEVTTNPSLQTGVRGQSPKHRYVHQASRTRSHLLGLRTVSWSQSGFLALHSSVRFLAHTASRLEACTADHPRSGLVALS